MLKLFLSLGVFLSALPDDVEAANDGNWCEKMQQEFLVGPDGMVKGNFNTRWELIDRYASGKKRSDFSFDGKGSSKTYFKENGRIEFTVLKSMKTDMQFSSLTIVPIYNNRGEVIREEQRDQNGILNGWVDYKYDAQSRLIEYSATTQTESAIENHLVTLSYDTLGMTETEISSTIRNDFTEYEMKRVSKYDLAHRLLVEEVFSMNDSHEWQLNWSELNEYDESQIAGYFRKKVEINNIVSQANSSETTISFYDKSDRLLSAWNKEASGNLTLKSRNEYSDQFDDLSRLVSSEILTYRMKDGSEILDGKILILHRYGSKGIEATSSKSFDRNDILRSGYRTIYSYCN